MAYYDYYDDDGDEYRRVVESESDYDYNTFKDNEFVNNIDWWHTYETCVLPSTTQVSWYIGNLLGWSLINRIGVALVCRFRYQTKTNWPAYTISIITGFCILIQTMRSKSIVIVCACGISYTILRLLYATKYRKNIGVLMLLITLSTHLGYELLWKKRTSWQVIRGPLMIANMKIISLAFELREESTASMNTRKAKAPSITIPNILSFFGYILMPSNLSIGPWVSYSSFLYSIRPGSTSISAMQELTSDMRWIIWCLLCIMLSLVFLNMSNCLVPLFFTYRSWPIWLRIFRDAFAVRCSHYFISFLSQAAIAIGGVSFKHDVRPNAWLGYMVTQPLQIEFPRSLNTVVRIWNIPTHSFLKHYIFRGVYSSCGHHFFAIFATYFVSSLLHGEYLKIYLILLSLACFTFAEYKLRDKLAHAFNACVAANQCRKPCRFKFCPSRGWGSEGAILVKLTNCLFSLLTIFHLAYLGALMYETGENERKTVGYLDDIRLWSSLSYVNHWVALTTFGLYLVF